MGTDFVLLESLVACIVRDLDALGYRKAIFRYDGSAALDSLISVVKSKWSGDMIPEITPEFDPSSNGNAERGVGLLKNHVRTLKYFLEEQLGVPIPDDHNILTWMVAHASTCYNRYHLGADGRTPKERVLGRKLGPPLAQFGGACLVEAAIAQRAHSSVG